MAQLEMEKGDATGQVNCMQSLVVLLKGELGKGSLTLKRVQALLAADRMLRGMWDRIDLS